MFTFPLGHIGAVAPSFDGTIFAGGTNGAIIKSTDGGATWTDKPVETGFDGGLTGVYDDGTNILMFGQHGFVQSTTDGGATWTDCSISYNETVTAIIYDTSNSVWIAAVRDRIYTSADLSTWTYRGQIVAFNDVTGFAEGSSKIVAVGWNGLVATSTDGGVTWTLRSFASLNPMYDMQSVVFADSKFVAVGEGGSIQTSSDGITWTAQTSGTTEHLYGLDFFDGTTWVAVGSNQMIVISTDAVSWARSFPGVGQNATATFYRVRSDGTSLIIVSNNDSDYQTSTDAVTFTKRDITITGYTPITAEVPAFWDAAWDAGNSVWIIAGKVSHTSLGFDTLHWKSLCLSDDAVTGPWAQLTPAGRSWRTYRSFMYDAANDDWYAVSDGTGTIIKTTDGGDTWTQINLGATAFGTADPIGGLWFDGTSYLVAATSSDRLFRSTDFSTWTKVADMSDMGTTSTFHPYRTGGKVNGQWLIPTKRGTLLKSSDGITWTHSALPTSNGDLYQVAYGNNIYVVTAATGRLFTSTDLTTWTLRATSNGTSSPFIHLHFDGAWFFAYTSSGQIHRSEDGVTWITLPSVGSGHFEAATEYQYSVSTNKGKLGIMPNASGLERVADHFTFTQISLSIGFLGVQWKAVAFVPD